MVSIWTPLSDPRIAARWFSLAEHRAISRRCRSRPALARAMAVALARHAAATSRRSSPRSASSRCASSGSASASCPTSCRRRSRLWDAAASPRSQAFLLIGTLFLLPIIIMYTAWSYCVFRGKVQGAMPAITDRVHGNHRILISGKTTLIAHLAIPLKVIDNAYLRKHPRRAARPRRPRHAQPAEAAQRAQRRADERAGRRACRVRWRRRRRRDGGHRQRQGLRGRRRHRRDGELDVHGRLPHRLHLAQLGDAALDPQARHRRGRRIRARRRLRARDDVRLHHRRRRREVRPAGDQARHHSRAPAARSACRARSASRRRWTWCSPRA